MCILGKAPQKRLIGIPRVVSWGSSVGAGVSTYGRVCSRPAGRCWLSAGTSARAEAGRPASLLTGCLVFLQHSGWTPGFSGKETFLQLPHRECRASDSETLPSAPFSLFLTQKLSPFTFLFLNFYLFFWPCLLACRILVPQPGIEPMSPAVETQTLNHWTAREIPGSPLKR